MSNRYVILGAARARAEWFAEVARWSNDGSLPALFIKCFDVDELVSRAAGFGRISMVLLDGSAPGVDVGLFGRLSRYCDLVVVVDDDVRTTWTRVGASHCWPSTVTLSMVRTLLEERGVPAGAPLLEVAQQAVDIDVDDARAGGGGAIAVIGRSGAGVSTLAAVLAQGLADDPALAGRVCLADLALDASQALLHDTGDVIPGVQEFAESHQRARPSRRAVRRMTFSIDHRRYDLLLGLRRPTDWPSVGPQELAASVISLRRAYEQVVFDLDGTLEGEKETGSIDIEERHAMARHAVAIADVVVVVGRGDLRGVHQLVRQCHTLDDLGIEPGRVLPVVNQAPRTPQERSEIAAAFGELRRVSERADTQIPGLVFVRHRRHLDRVHRRVDRFPDTMTTPLRRAVLAVLDRVGPSEHTPAASTALRLVASE